MEVSLWIVQVKSNETLDGLIEILYRSTDDSYIIINLLFSLDDCLKISPEVYDLH